MNELIEGLNENQRAAVLYNEGPSLIIAGAGSGKTRVLTVKIAQLLQQGLDPSQILALTFTNKAAREMKSRIATLVGTTQARRLWMGTFHSIFSRILRHEADKIGFSYTFTIYDTADSKNLIKAIIKEKGLDDKIYKPQIVLSRISSAKNNLISPTMYAADREIVEGDFRSKMPMVRDIYAEYSARCRHSDAMDFDDLLFYTNLLFRDHKEVEERYQHFFKFILVDEYQDTNFSQHLIVQRLAARHNRVCVVGDDAQSIYSFRGANIDNILSFQKRFEGTRIFKLEQNYRSTQRIVGAANSLIAKNRAQIPKKVFSNNEPGDPIAILSAQSDIEESKMVATRIHEKRRAESGEYLDFAILYRTNAQSRLIENALRDRAIPYRIYGGQSFYQRKEIKDIIAYLRLVINSHDEEAFKRIINTPARGIGDTTLKKITDTAILHATSPYTVAADPIRYNLPINAGTAKKLLAFHEIIESSIRSKEELSLVDLVTTIIHRSGLKQELVGSSQLEDISRKENIDEFLKGVQEYVIMKQEEGNESPSLEEFLSEIALITDQDKQEEASSHYVTLMTVHASKGLEFKHVMIVGMEENLFPSSMSMSTEREIEEERRLFYVALTRACKTCAIYFAQMRFRNGMSEFSRPSRFLSELGNEFITTERTAINPKGIFRKEDNDLTLRQRSIERAKQFQREQSAAINHIPTQIPSSNAPYKQFDTLPVGTWIEHERFGVGEVIECHNEQGTAKAHILFNDVGEKALLLKFAKLRLLKS